MFCLPPGRNRQNGERNYMGNKIKKFMGLDKHDEYISDKLEKADHKALTFVSAFTALLGLGLIVTLLIYKVAIKEKPRYYTDEWQRIHFIAYGVLVLVALITFAYCIFIYKKTKTNENSLQVMAIIFCVSLSYYGVFISIMDLQVGRDGNIFILTQIMILGNMTLIPFIHIISSFSIFFVYAICAYAQNSFTLQNGANLVLVWGVLIVIATMRYHSNLKMYEYQEQMDYYSSHDGTTGLFNRLAMVGHLPYYMNEQVIVMMCDIDDFKKINDTYGHDVGDDILIRFGKLLKEHFGDYGCFRYGGDEFAVISETEESTFIKKCEKLRGDFEDYTVKSTPVKLSFTGGYVVGSIKDVSEFNELVKKADILLYESKENIKSQVIGKKVS